MCIRDRSTIEPFSYQDPERWAEFIVFLKGSKQSGVNNLAVIDAEEMCIRDSLLAKGALTPLISSVWSFTAALLANPVTWIVIGIVALIAALVLLYNKCEC